MMIVFFNDSTNQHSLSGQLNKSLLITCRGARNEKSESQKGTVKILNSRKKAQKAQKKMSEPALPLVSYVNYYS
jgi:hypothetical protein